MSNPPLSNTAVRIVPSTADDSACTITAGTEAPTNFPPPKTDKPRLYVCDTCQRSFARLEHLKRHERSHTKENPFKCPECKRCFARRDLLLRHQQKLHQTSTLSSRPRNRHESADGIPSGQSRACKKSFAGPNPSNGPGPSMRPRANTISHVDSSTMQTIAAANFCVPGGIPLTHTHTRHLSLAGLPIPGLDHGMSAAMEQRGVHHGLPKLEKGTSGSLDFSSGLQRAPPIAVLNSDFNSKDLFGPGTTINSNDLHYNILPQSTALEQASPFALSMNEMPSRQILDDSFDGLIGFEYQMPFHMNENVVDRYSPSAINPTSQSGISDVMPDGSNPGTSTIWQPSVMDSLQIPKPFAIVLDGSVFPDLLNGTSLSPQPASQKINGPYLSTPSPEPSPLGSSDVTRPLASISARRCSPPFAVATTVSPVTIITDTTRSIIANTEDQGSQEKKQSS
ncbi:hypothetical protein MRS44_017181 [Fusarium solani]|uniref:uncharacterized protein n=1 Tax=Fusarium solani TaxID=169388 RepID=UPI0023154832|nr:hypothetical protein MRS44_017181 [Fusarium solani]KAJ4187807.1 hypothetical protein NW759_016868 [Fusarium solani]